MKALLLYLVAVRSRDQNQEIISAEMLLQLQFGGVQI